MLNWKHWQRACLIHARSKSFREKVEKANKLITEVLLKSEKPAIAFSTGKDSTVVYHLVKDIAPDIDAFHYDDEFMLQESKHYLERIGNVKIKKIEEAHTEWFITNEGQNDNVKEFDTIFLGMRAAENGYRKRHLAKMGLAYYAKKYNQIICNPIAWWSIEDVWAYIFSTKRDYNQAYRVMHEKGISVEKQRIGPFANRRAIQYGQLANLKKCFPNDYNQFIKKYPEAKGYV
jgi:3'-phosphoadenosine 5'-phosphosulfate sulfotransferase (PAPS reductase)/FAD synthetase